MTNQTAAAAEPKTFPVGTIAKCNRCGQSHPLPKVCIGVQENASMYRLQTMATLDCGHMDAHWVKDSQS